MPVCPICEHSQVAADTCEVCGKALSEIRLADAPVEAVPGLDTARWQESSVGDAEPLTDIQPTAQAGGAAAAAETVTDPFSDLERTGIAPVDIGAIAPVPDLDRGREVDDGAREPWVEGPATCRYCKHVQAVGMFCDQCGMRLPRFTPAAAPGHRPESGETRRCIRCSEKVVPGTRCGRCGTLAAAPDG